MNYKFVIPSYKRVEGLKNKTLKFLNDMGVNHSDVYIFSSPDDNDEYVKEFGDLYTVITSRNTITEKRNHIIEYFDEGEYIIELDDDVEDIICFYVKQIDGISKSVSLKDKYNTIYDFVNECFQPNVSMWGIASTTNPYFGGRGDFKGIQLRSMIASVCGYINDKRIKLTLKDKEDFERVILYYDLGKTTLKRTDFGIKTKYWTNKGGIEAQYKKDERKILQWETADILVERYPNYVYKQVRKNGIADIRFRRTKGLNKML